MESNGRFSYPDSPHPGFGPPSAQLANQRPMLIIGIIMFVAILAGALGLAHRHLESETEAILTGDKAIASLLAVFIGKHNNATLAILQSYANRSSFITAARNKDSRAAARQLSALQSSAGIDLTFVTDPAAVLWVNFPHFPEAIGKDLSHREWYEGIRTQWKPYISSAFKLIAADQPLAVAICIPVYDEDKSVIGILATSQRLLYLKETIENLPLIPNSRVSVVDQAGQMLYSNTYPYHQQLARHPLAEDILATTTQDTAAPIGSERRQGRDGRYFTVVPVDSSGWKVIIERSRNDIFLAQRRHFLELGFTSFLFYVLIMALVAYLEKTSLVKKTEKLLQAEQALHALSARHEAILAAVPEIIMEVDSNKVYTWANSVGIEFFGEDVLGKEASFYFENEQDTYAKVQPLFQGAEERMYVESWQRRRDGEIRLLAWWCRCLRDETGKIRGAVSSGYDITDQRHAEDKFRHIFESSVTGISITQPSGEVTVNPAFASMLGYEAAELQDATWQEISHPDDVAATRQAIQPLLDGKADAARFIKRCFHKNGATLWADLGTTLRRDSSGKPLYFVSTINDITERKRVEDELRQSEANFRAMVESIPVVIYLSRGEEQVGEFLNRQFTVS